MKAPIILCAAALTMASSPVMAGDVAGVSAPVAATPEQPKPEKLVCKRDVAVGTRLSKSICLTRSQWRQRDREAEYNTDNLRDKYNREAVTPMPKGGG